MTVFPFRRKFAVFRSLCMMFTCCTKSTFSLAYLCLTPDYVLNTSITEFQAKVNLALVDIVLHLVDCVHFGVHYGCFPDSCSVQFHNFYCDMFPLMISFEHLPKISFSDLLGANGF